ncbi:MAG TPA: glycosyltransferase family 2 protein, partial [Acidimicrobiales bacterium]|nr:glycosyltransferase family 2 protein [Acidimicrobiales bacterium]
MKVVGVYLVRNEADVIETNLRHHFETVLAEAIVVDNGSSDGTLELLADLADELPLQVASELGHIFQSGRVTRMARFAVQQGADWVLPLDADEFWVAADRPFRSVLEAAPADARALFVEVINFVQQRDVLAVQPGVLRTMTLRPPHPVGTAEDASRLVRTGEVGWLELTYTPKCVLRGTPDIVVAPGNHLTGIDGGYATGALACLHAPIRARSILLQKIDHGRRLLEEHSSAEAGWHVKRWWQMARAGTLDEEWEALSSQDGAITVNGAR